MTLCAARVAPEKAVFRPALPLHSSAGHIGNAMATKNAYFEKLRDPRWQRMRLEVMNRDEFTCQNCFDSESTLNVHHRVYVKGRDPWEYPLPALVTLCEPCHQEEGQVSEAIHSFLTNVWPSYAFGQDTSRFENLGAFIAIGRGDSHVSPYDEEAWRACIGAITHIFAHERDADKNPLIKPLLDVFTEIAKDHQGGNAE